MTEFSTIWTELVEEAANKSRGRVVRRVGPASGPATFLAVDCGTRRRSILAELQTNLSELRGFPDWREMRLAILRGGSIHRQCLGIELQSPEFTDVFSAIAEDLVRELWGLKDNAQRLNRLRDRLQKWNRFMKEHGHQGLSEDEVRGLFAELWVLQEHLIRELGGRLALEAWTGPDAKAQDFVRGRFAFEVKSTGYSHPEGVAISSEVQLDSNPWNELWLDILRLEDSGSGVSLPELVDSLRGRVREDAETLQEFERKLTRAGYLEEFANRYQRRYNMLQEAVYRVVDGFPRIVNPPPGVHSVRYQLSIAAIQRFRVSAETAFTEFRGKQK